MPSTNWGNGPWYTINWDEPTTSRHCVKKDFGHTFTLELGGISVPGLKRLKTYWTTTGEIHKVTTIIDESMVPDYMYGLPLHNPEVLDFMWENHVRPRVKQYLVKRFKDEMVKVPIGTLPPRGGRWRRPSSFLRW